MFTSRAEYRILLRQDNADTRLTPHAIRLGLAEKERRERFHRKNETKEALIDTARKHNVSPREINGLLERKGSPILNHGCKLSEIVARPGIRLDEIIQEIPEMQAVIEAHFPTRLSEESNTASLEGNTDSAETIEAAEILLKYDGYIARERAAADKMQRLENIRIRDHFDYETVNALSTEARQKLSRINPETLAQASRIPGVSPSDISVLLILLGR